MKQKLTALRTKPMTSTNGTWTKTEVKFEGTGEEVFELKGFSAKYPPKVGSTINGYLTTREWNGGSVRVFNKITADYLYDLLMNSGVLGAESTKVATPTPEASAADDGWGGAPTPEPQGDDNW